MTFLELARDWYRVQGPRPECEVKRIKKYILPGLGRLEVGSICARDVLRVCRAAESFGYTETAWRVKGTVSLILRFGVASGVVGSDVSATVGDALRSRPRHHYPCATRPEQLMRLHQSILGYPFPVVRGALLLSLFTFARPAEVRGAAWAEFDLPGALWRVPAERTKTLEPHLVPLSRQALSLLEQQRSINPVGKWVFPSPIREGEHIGESACRNALHRLGWRLAPHSFRATASTVLNELGYSPDAIEAQLGHRVGSVRAAYNHALYLAERRRMMQLWVDWLEALPEVVL